MKGATSEMATQHTKARQEKKPTLWFYVREDGDYDYDWREAHPEEVKAVLEARWRIWRNDPDPNKSTPRAGFQLDLRYADIPTDDVAFTLDGPPNIFDELDRVADDIKHFLKEHRNAASNA